MQRLEVSGAVRPIYGSLGVKRLSNALCGRNAVLYSAELQGIGLYSNHWAFRA